MNTDELNDLWTHLLAEEKVTWHPRMLVMAGPMEKLTLLYPFTKEGRPCWRVLVENGPEAGVIEAVGAAVLSSPVWDDEPKVACTEADAEFVAAAREDVPLLVREFRNCLMVLSSEIGRLEGALSVPAHARSHAGSDRVMGRVLEGLKGLLTEQPPFEVGDRVVVIADKAPTNRAGTVVEVIFDGHGIKVEHDNWPGSGLQHQRTFNWTYAEVMPLGELRLVPLGSFQRESG